jgi:hypothetical protein
VFSRFTASARRVMQRAFREAKRWRHDFVGTEHLLLGLLCSTDSPTSTLLHELNANPDLLLEKVELSLQQHGDVTDQERFPLSPALRRVFESADAEAAAFRHLLIAPEHLLLALMHESESAAAQILASHGVGFDQLRRAVAHLPADETPDAQVKAGDGKRPFVAPDSLSADDLEDQVLPIMTVDSTTYPSIQIATPKEVFAQLRRTQMVLAGFMGFAVGFWTFNWQVGAFLALAGIALAYWQQIWVSIIVGMFLPALMIVVSGIWPPDQYVYLPLVMFAGGFLGSFLGAVWRLADVAPEQSVPDQQELVEAKYHDISIR